MGHIGVKLTTFTLVHNFLSHLVRVRPIKSGSVCFGHDGPRGRIVTTGPRVNIIEDHSAFFWRDALLADSSCTFSEQLSLYHSKGLRSPDDLSSLFLILWEFLPKNLSNVWHCPVGSNDQNLHDQVDHGWDFDFSRICGTLGLWRLFSERIFPN